MSSLNSLTNQVLELSLNLLSEQSFVPESPASLDVDGNVNLCLAGIIAKAGLLATKQQKRVSNFERDLIDTSSKERLEEEFKYLGWSSISCKKQIAFNDRTSFSIRKQVLIAYLQNCKDKNTLLNLDVSL
ncbi:MAG: hypothetical protein AAGF83_21090 [Cyanobacteria bacterium P01_G01_bin.67]